MKRARCRAVLVLNHGMFFREREKLAALAIVNKIALSTPYLRSAEAGALIAHEVDFDQVWRLNASYVAKILQGAKAGDLPVQRVSGVHYAINLKTAKALDLTVHAPILRSAALVIGDSAKADAIQKVKKTDDVPIDADLTKAIAARAEAERNRDIEAFSRMTTNDFTLTSQQGEIITRAARIEQLRTGPISPEPTPQSDEQIRMYGDTALRTRP